MTTPAIRVLHVVEDPMTAAIILEPIIRRQLERGYEVEVVGGPGEYLDAVRQTGAEYHQLPFDRRMAVPSNLVRTLQLIRLIRKKRYDVVHVHTPVAGFFGRFSAWAARAPVVIHHLRGSLWGTTGITPHLYTVFEWLAGWWTDYTFTINSADAADLVRLRIRRRETVQCLGCGSGGLNTAKFARDAISDEEPARVRRELGLEPEHQVVGFIGRFIRRKGIVDLLDAFEDLVEEYPQARLLLVGGSLGSSRDRNTAELVRSRLAQSDRLKERVIITGFRSDTPELISAMDLLVLPSHFEGFGMVLLEAGAMGIPVISTATRGGREAVVDGHTGLLVPPKEPGALREAIAKLLASGELRTRLGEAGHRRATSELDEASIFERVDRVYRRLLDGRERQGSGNGAPGAYSRW